MKSRQDSAFEIEFYEKVLHRDPTQIDALRQLGHLYTRSGRVRDGLRADLALAILCPTDSVAHYNLACSYALVDDIERGLSSLAEAIELGYGDVEYLRNDPDLEALRKDPSFAGLLTRVK